MIYNHNQSDAEYIASMKSAWGTQLDPYILTIRNLENKFESLCAQLDKLEEQQKAHDTLKAEHRRLLEDRRFWFEECDRIKARYGSENAKHQQQRNALRVSLEEALKENARLRARLLPQSSSTATGRDTRGPTGWVLHAKRPPKTLSIQQLIEGHAEALRLSVEGFPYWVQELMVKEQLGFFEPILEGPEDCPKTC